MEIKEYTHYGIRVTKQMLYGRRFADALEKDKIEYEMMPVEIQGEAEVYIYSRGDEKRYAFVTGGGSVDGFYETIYITTAIPDDLDWWALANDVDQQEKGKPPLRMHTRFYFCFLKCEDKVEEEHEITPDNLFENFEKPLDEIIPNFWEEVAWEMQKYYDTKDIKKYGYSAWDIDNDIVDKLMQTFHHN